MDGSPDGAGGASGKHGTGLGCYTCCRFLSGHFIFADLAATEMLTVGQVTILSSLMLIVHSLPIELQIAGKAGSRWLSMGIIRVGGALLYGMILNQYLLTLS